MDCDGFCRYQRSLHVLYSYLASFSLISLKCIFFNETEQLCFFEKEVIQFIVDLCAHWEVESTGFIIFLLMFT